MPGIRAVFFDIGNVVVAFTPGRVIRRLAWDSRINPLAVVRLLWDQSLVDRIERGTLKPRALYRVFRKDMGFRGSFERFKRVWCESLKLIAPTSALVRRLAKRHRVYLLSNTNVLHYEWMRKRYAFIREARGAVLSYKVRLRKPEPAIYKAAIKLARVPAEQIVFIDDLADNVKAARKAGMKAIRYTGTAALKEDLKKLGVN